MAAVLALSGSLHATSRAEVVLILKKMPSAYQALLCLGNNLARRGNRRQMSMLQGSLCPGVSPSL